MSRIVGQWLVACILTFLLPVAFVHADSKARPSLSFLFENDSFLGADGSYTGGFSLSYESDELLKHDPGSKIVRWSSMRRHLPGFTELRDERVLLSVSGVAFTPEDISQIDPSPDEPPYAGIVALDAQLVSRNFIDQHAYTVRFGWVGPSSQMGNVQEAVHDLTSSEDPQGWDAQLPDEPLVNLSYSYSRRIKTNVLGNGWEWDVAPGVGVSAGNYLTAAHASVLFRFGNNMSNSFGTTSIDGGVRGSGRVVDGLGDRWRQEWSLGVAAFLVGHYLPYDGTLLKDSASVEREDVISVASLGYAIGRGRMQVDLVYNLWSDAVEGALTKSEYAGVHFTWFLD